MDHIIDISGFSFSEPEKSINAGDRVSWNNMDEMAHTATRQIVPGFETGMIPPGAISVPILFPNVSPPGGFEYFCRPHPFMRGRLHVQPAEYSEPRAIEFWHDFDSHTKYGDPASPLVQAFSSGLGNAGPFSCYLAFRSARRAPLDEARFSAEFGEYAQSVAPALATIAEFTIATMQSHFGHPEHLQRAFEDFGQGILLDTVLDPVTGEPRRPALDRLHTMDFGGDLPGDQGTPQAYHAWHAWIQAAVFAGGDPATWLPINRLVGLAWGIQTESRPRVDTRNPAPVDSERLAVLRDFWLTMEFNGLDTAFDRAFDQPPVP